MSSLLVLISVAGVIVANITSVSAVERSGLQVNTDLMFLQLIRTNETFATILTLKLLLIV